MTMADKLTASNILAIALRAHHAAVEDDRKRREERDLAERREYVATFAEALEVQFGIAGSDAHIEISGSSIAYTPPGVGVTFLPDWRMGDRPDSDGRGYAKIIARVTCPSGCGYLTKLTVRDLVRLGELLTQSVCRTCHRPFADGIEAAL